MQMLTIHHYPAAGTDDFCWGVEGELAVPMPPCARADCGCERSHIGLNSRKASTTAKVSELDLSFDDLMIAFAGYWVRAWPDAAGLGDIAEKLAHEMITVATDAAANYPPGTVLRPRYDHSAEEWRYHIASGVS